MIQVFWWQWELVCERSALLDVTVMLMNVGAALGNIFGTHLGDHYGRRHVMAVSTLLLGVVCLASAFSPVYSVFAVSTFVRGILFGVSHQYDAQVLEQNIYL